MMPLMVRGSSQSFIVLSVPPLAKILRSWLKATDRTWSVWPVWTLNLGSWAEAVAEETKKTRAQLIFHFAFVINEYRNLNNGIPA